MKLSTSNVERIFLDCLFKDNEIDAEHKPKFTCKVVEGVKGKIGFHYDRLVSYKKDIISLLSQLPDEFKTCPKEEGLSFLGLCYDVDGIQWGEHKHMDQLVCLGQGLGLVINVLPRELWVHLPANMPFIAINLKPRGSN